MTSQVLRRSILRPACGQPVDEVQWEPTLVRSNISKAGIIDAAPFDTMLSVPPGTFTVLPCGHQVSPEVLIVQWMLAPDHLSP